MGATLGRLGKGHGGPESRSALLILCLVAPTLGCGRTTPSAGECPTVASSAPDPGVTPGGAAPGAGDPALADIEGGDAMAPPAAWPSPCVGTVAEYCATLGGRCPTYDESVERARRLCAYFPWVVTARGCGHVYRSVSWNGGSPVGGGDEYFDRGGRLIGAYLYTDYGAYCNHTSFSQTFGTIPTCPTRALEVDLCLRQPPG